MQNKYGLTPSHINLITDVFKDHQGIEQVILFGSRAKGNYKPGSDVDFAVVGSNMTARDINNISYQLNEETVLPYYFDVLEYSAISSEELIHHINEYGIPFYKSLSKA